MTLIERNELTASTVILYVIASLPITIKLVNRADALKMQRISGNDKYLPVSPVPEFSGKYLFEIQRIVCVTVSSVIIIAPDKSYIYRLTIICVAKTVPHTLYNRDTCRQSMTPGDRHCETRLNTLYSLRTNKIIQLQFA